MDLKTAALTEETARVLEAVRVARVAADAANADVEAMIWEVQHVQLGRQRMVFSIDGLDDDEARPLN